MLAAVLLDRNCRVAAEAGVLLKAPPPVSAAQAPARFYSQRADVERFIDETDAHFGRLDILVNNASGSTGFNLVGDLEGAAWNEALNWMLNATFWGMRRALGYRVPNQWGRIINVSSIEYRQANLSMASHYITNKHAITWFTKADAFENGTAGITCNTLIVGPVETDLMLSAGPQFAAEQGIT